MDKDINAVSRIATAAKIHRISYDVRKEVLDAVFIGVDVVWHNCYMRTSRLTKDAVPRMVDINVGNG